MGQSGGITIVPFCRIRFPILSVDTNLREFRGWMKKWRVFALDLRAASDIATSVRRTLPNYGDRDMNITLPDGTEKQFEGPITGFQLAESIGPGLLKAALAVEVDGVQQDLSEPITKDSLVNILTVRTDAGLEIMRHTIAAQVLARAVRELYPGSKLAIGPTIEHGFYYDVEFERPLSEDEFPKIEEKMKEIVAEKNPIQMRRLDRNDSTIQGPK